MDEQIAHVDYSDLQALEILASEVVKVSNATTGRTTDWRGEQSSLALAKVGITCLTFLRLVPGSSYFTPSAKLEVWDLSAIASQARALIESYYLLCYLVCHPKDDSESEFQESLWRYHEAFERYEMLRAGVPDSKQLQRIADELAGHRSRLESSHAFKKLSEKHREWLLNGKGFKLPGAVELSRTSGISESYYRSKYRYCSAFAHSAPFSISQLRDFRAGTPEAKRLLFSLVSLACGYTAMALRDALKLYPDQTSSVPPNVAQIMSIWEGILRWERSPYFSGDQSPT